VLCGPAEETIELGARAERFYWIVMARALLVLSVGLVKVSPAAGCTEAPNQMTVRAVDSKALYCMLGMATVVIMMALTPVRRTKGCVRELLAGR
jgi:hypothetical protein